MFSNIGNKIRTLAKVICFIGIGISAVAGLVVMITGFSMLGRYSTAGAGVGMIFGGLFIAALGCLYSWVGSFVLYGYGQLIHSTQRIEKQICGDETESFGAPVPNAAPVAPVQPAGKVCSSCGYVNDSDAQFCVGCGKPI